MSDKKIIKSDSIQTSGFAMTYGQLKTRVAEVQRAKGMSQQQMMNIASALNGWMKRLQFNNDNLIGDEMASNFDEYFLHHQDYLAEKLSHRTFRDQTEHLLTWRRHFEEYRHTDTLPPDFKGAFNALFSQSGLTKAELARRSGVNTASIHRWLDLIGLPVAHSTPEIGCLEKALNVPEGTLLNRLPGRRYSRYARTMKETRNLQTSWGRKRTEEKKTLGAYALPLKGAIHEQWLDLIEYKTDGYRDGGTKQNTWRIKTASETGCRISKAMVSSNGAMCATAAANWAGFSSYLGFLCLKPQGKALTEGQAGTLAWLLHFPYLIDYVRWLTNRAGGKIHGGIPKFLDDVKSMLRPITGYLWLHPELADTLPNSDTVLGRDYAQLDVEHKAEHWRLLCGTTHLKIREKVKAIRGREKIWKSRDPKEPIADILSNPSPLKALLKFVYELESSPPPLAHHRDYIVWIRDVLFAKMLVSNPLRMGQFAVIRYTQNNKGNLYKTSNGDWRLRFTSADFKNEKGAANQDYDVAVEPSVGPWITRYLAESRPELIASADCDFFLLPAVLGPNNGMREDGDYSTSKGGMWTGEGLSKRFKILTRQYIPDTPGFGGHAVRHIIATDHLKRHPGDYPTVAKLLHDKLETVLREYSHLTVDQGLQVLHQDIRLFSAERV